MTPEEKREDCLGKLESFDASRLSTNAIAGYQCAVLVLIVRGVFDCATALERIADKLEGRDGG